MPRVCKQNRPRQEAKEALILDQCKWKELQDIVSTNERLAMQAAENAKYIQDRKDLSAKMQSEWDNTYVNMRKKRFEEMEARRVMAETERENKYWQLRREEQELREQITARAMNMLSQEKDYTKNINRALLLSEILRERKAQVDFNNSLRQKEIEREIDYARSVEEDVKKFHEEENAKSGSNSLYRDKLKEQALQMLKEAHDVKINAVLKQRAEGQEELKRLAKEIKEQEEIERKEKIRQREIAISNIEENIRMKEEYKLKLLKEEEEEDTKIRIISEAKKKLNAERKKKEKEDQAAAVARRNKIANQVAAAATNLEDEENERIAKAREEKDAADDLKAKKELQYQEKLKKERIQSYEVYKMEEEKKKQGDYEMSKWTMLQRFKKDEIIKEFEAEEAKKQCGSTKDSRVHWNKQIKERMDKEQQEVKEDVDALNKALQVWRNEDKANLKYADEIIEECKKVGRPTYPIESVLQSYKREIGAVPKRPLSATWKSNIPIFNPAVEEEAEKRQINRPKFRPKCGCVPRNGIF